jgi:hypothetical protein
VNEKALLLVSSVLVFTLVLASWTFLLTFLLTFLMVQFFVNGVRLAMPAILE